MATCTQAAVGKQHNTGALFQAQRYDEAKSCREGLNCCKRKENKKVPCEIDPVKVFF